MTATAKLIQFNEAPRKATASAGDQKPSSEPLLELGRELGRLWSRNDELDRSSLKLGRGHDDHWKLDLAMKKISRRARQLEDAVPAFKAQSVGAAIVSLVRASALADTINDQREALKDEELERRFNEWHRALSACLYSVLGVLREAAPGVYEETGGEAYMWAKLDDFRALDNAEEVLASSASKACLKGAEQA